MLDSEGGTLPPDPGSGDGESSPYLQAVRAFQQMYETNVLKALTYVPGVSVAATVELTPELESTQEVKNYTDKNGVKRQDIVAFDSLDSKGE